METEVTSQVTRDCNLIFHKLLDCFINNILIWLLFYILYFISYNYTHCKGCRLFFRSSSALRSGDVEGKR